MGDEKNTHWGGQISFFFDQFSRNILFSSLFYLFLSFAFAFACFFFEIKNIYSDTHSTMQVVRKSTKKCEKVGKEILH